MNTLRRAADIFLHAAGLITVCAVLLCGATAVVLPPDYAVPLAVYGLVGGGTLAAYNYHALVQQYTGDRPALPHPLPRLQRSAVSVGGVLAGLSLMRLPVGVWVLATALGILIVLYSTPIFLFGRKRRLKDFGGLKILVLAAVWTLATTLIPAAGAGLPLADAWAVLRDEIFVRALLLLPLCLVFDIRDAAPDAAAGVHTLAVRLGARRAGWLAAALLALFGAANAFVFRDFLPFAVLGFCVAGYGGLAARAAVRSGGSAVAYLGWLDGTLALYAASRILAVW